MQRRGVGPAPSRFKTWGLGQRHARSGRRSSRLPGREIDLVLVWRLDRWGRSLVDLVSTLQELNALDVGFVSLSEALDLTTPSGRALAGMQAVFAEFERDILGNYIREYPEGIISFCSGCG